MVGKILYKNRRGWIRIVEVFITMLLITSVLFIILQGRNLRKIDTEEIYETEIVILRDIELNVSLRNEILSANIPVEPENFETSLPNTKARINERIPSNMKCEAKLCELTDKCVFNNSQFENTYAESVVIAASTNIYSPRQLKLFCSQNEA